jgi:hypothetical protein
MTLDEIRQTIADALPLRVPRFTGDDTPREKVAQLEDYLMQSAEQRGALIEARHWLRELEDVLRGQIDALEGWQSFLPKGAPTKTAVNDAKRQAAPNLYAQAAEIRKLLASVDDQVDRFAFEDQIVVSRCYSMISGS